MDPQDNDTLEAVLLRKAASIGRPKLPEPTLSMMPLPSSLFGIGKIGPFVGNGSASEMAKQLLRRTPMAAPMSSEDVIDKFGLGAVADLFKKSSMPEVPVPPRMFLDAEFPSSEPEPKFRSYNAGSE